MKELTNMSPKELLILHGQILDELKKRGIAKTRNQPISEYSKWLVRNKLQLKDVQNPNEKYDGIDKDGYKYLVRSRQIIDNRPVRFSVIRNIEDRNFDFLVVVTFDKNCEITESYIIPIDFLLEEVEYNEHQNGYLLKLPQLNLNHNRIRIIKNILRG